jgi:ABC-2 type transport system permease protein
VIPLLRAELVKLRTTRTFAALTGVAVATSMLIGGLTAGLDEPTESSVLTDVFNSDTSSLFILVLAILGISGEWRHRTITSALLAAPDRLRFLAAKTLAFAAAGMLLSLLISIAIAILGYAILSARDLPVPEFGDLIAQVGRDMLVAALLGGLGVGIGGVVRNQPVAIVGVLLVIFVLEPGLISLDPDVGRFGPFYGLPIGVQDLPPDSNGYSEFDPLTPALAALGMLAWISAFFAAAGALLYLRDVD